MGWWSHAPGTIKEVLQRQRTRAIPLPAVLVREPVKGDGPVSTRTFEEPLHAIMPVEVMLFADAGLQWLEVGVGTLHRQHKPHAQWEALKEGLGAAESLPATVCPCWDFINSSFLWDRLLEPTLVSNSCSRRVSYFHLSNTGIGGTESPHQAQVDFLTLSDTDFLMPAPFPAKQTHRITLLWDVRKVELGGACLYTQHLGGCSRRGVSSRTAWDTVSFSSVRVTQNPPKVNK